MKPVTLSEPLVYQAEYSYRTSESTIYPSNDRTSCITMPQDSAKQLMNTLGGGTEKKWNTVGQLVTYQVEVPESGFYKIALRFNQNESDGSFVSRKLRVKLARDLQDYALAHQEVALAEEKSNEPIAPADQPQYEVRGQEEEEIIRSHAPQPGNAEPNSAAPNGENSEKTEPKEENKQMDEIKKQPQQPNRYITGKPADLYWLFYRGVQANQHRISEYYGKELLNILPSMPDQSDPKAYLDNVAEGFDPDKEVSVDSEDMRRNFGRTCPGISDT